MGAGIYGDLCDNPDDFKHCARRRRAISVFASISPSGMGDDVVGGGDFAWYVLDVAIIVSDSAQKVLK